MTAQASISFDAEYARVVKAVETAQARGDDFEQVVNACMAALAAAGIINDAPLDQLVARLAGERDEARRALYGASFVLAQAHQEGAKPVSCTQVREIALRAHDVLRRARGLPAIDPQARASSDHVAALQTQLEVTQRQLADLLAIIGTETPIAAFDLVTTWRMEKAGYMDRIAELERECASWRGLAERRRDELAGILEDAQALTQEIQQARAILGAVEGETLSHAAEILVYEEQTSHEACQWLHHRYWKEAVPTIAALTRELATLRADHSATTATIEKLTLALDEGSNNGE